MGSTFESHLKEIGIYEEVQKSALKQTRVASELDEAAESFEELKLPTLLAEIIFTVHSAL